MYCTAGAAEAHNSINLNVAGDLHQQLRSRPCHVLASLMRVRTPSNLFTYPDALVVCDEPVFLDEREDTLLNPNLIVEVLSPSTERYDRGLNFEQYRTIESLREYLMLASDRIHAELFTRQPNGQWSLSEWSDREDTVPLQSCDCVLKLNDVYEKVKFSPTAQRLHSCRSATTGSTRAARRAGIAHAASDTPVTNAITPQ